MSDRMIPSRNEDSERKRLPALAKELGWTFRKDAGNDDSIHGQWDSKPMSIRVDSKLLLHDVLEVSAESPSQLVAMVCRETFFTKGSQALANFLKGMGLDAKCDIKTGDAWIDENF